MKVFLNENLAPQRIEKEVKRCRWDYQEGNDFWLEEFINHPAA
jgi:hypothetical protein